LARVLLSPVRILVRSESMISRRRLSQGGIAIITILLSGAPLPAQQGTINGPIGPIGTIAPAPTQALPVPVARLGVVADNPGPVQADNHTLASVEALGFGAPSSSGGFSIDPSIRVTQAGEKGLTPNWNGMNSLGVNLTLDHASKHSNFDSFYHGARVVHYPDSSANTAYHNFGAAEELRFGRWMFRIREDLMSSPDTTLGGFDIGGLVLPSTASAMNALQPADGNTDTILTQRAARLRSNTSGEVNYYFSRRSIFTAVSSYSSLTFSSSAFVDSHRLGGRLGYDYLLSAKNSIGILYDYSRTGFSSAAPNMQTNTAQLAFGHRLTGRLAFQLMGGPQQISRSDGSRQLSWTVSNNINFQARRTQYSFVYSHASAAGSGVFSGASLHSVGGHIQHPLTQSWTASTSAGFAFNQNLVPASGVANQFHTWYGAVSLERTVGRHLFLSMNYGFQRQDVSTCPVTGCGPATLRQTGGITMEWHPFNLGAR
jgi:hypothetical protein